jgi:hypothetical protein
MTEELLLTTMGAGGIFDFNATLPLFGLQFICLATVLIGDFYKPIQKDIAYREEDAKKGERRRLEIDEMRALLFRERMTWVCVGRTSARRVISTQMQDVRDRISEQLERQRRERKVEGVVLRKLFGWKTTRFSRAWLHSYLTSWGLEIRRELVEYISGDKADRRAESQR